MAKDIRDLNPDPSEFLSPEDEKSLRQLQKRKKPIEKELAGLESEMKTMKEAASGFERCVLEITPGCRRVHGTSRAISRKEEAEGSRLS